jgi:hypothetical protein
MSVVRHVVPLAALCCAVLAACASGDQAADSAAVTPDAATPAAPISLAQVAGRWNVRAIPESGTDTTPTMSVLVATPDTTGWTVAVAGGAAQPARVRVSGDSVIVEFGPSPSTRRPGATVTTTSVSRLQGDSLVGTSTSRYSTGADSVVRFRTTATRVP